MKNLILKKVLIASLVMFGLTSCQKDNTTAVVDARDQYVGTWNYKWIGSITLFQNGASKGTVPIDKSGKYEITKSGKKDLMIDGTLFFVNDKKLSSDPVSTTSTNNGVNTVGTAITKGVLGASIITLNLSETGTWSNSNGASGNYSGKAVATLSK